MFGQKKRASTKKVVFATMANARSNPSTIGTLKNGGLIWIQRRIQTWARRSGPADCDGTAQRLWTEWFVIASYAPYSSASRRVGQTFDGILNVISNTRTPVWETLHANFPASE